MQHISRAEWGATPPRRPFSRLRPSRVVGVVLHHSGVQNPPKGVDAVLAYEHHHVVRNKWVGIAYNWLVDEDGVCYEGRGAGVVSAATKGWNSRTESIQYTGWGSTDVPDAALRTIKAKIDEIQTRYGRRLWVKPHKSLGTTSCPGTVLINWLAEGMAAQAVESKDEGDAKLVRIAAEIARRPLSRRRRSKGEAVVAVQVRLKEKGHDPGVCDGVAGRLFDQATRSFQRTQGYLKADGIVGSKTFNALFKQ